MLEPLHVSIMKYSKEWVALTSMQPLTCLLPPRAKAVCCYSVQNC